MSNSEKRVRNRADQLFCNFVHSDFASIRMGMSPSARAGRPVNLLKLLENAVTGQVVFQLSGNAAYRDLGLNVILAPEIRSCLPCTHRAMRAECIFPAPLARTAEPDCGVKLGGDDPITTGSLGHRARLHGSYQTGVLALRENEEHYRDLVENSLDLICTHDLQGVVLTVNLAAARTLGYEPDEIVDRNVREFLSPKSYEEFGAFLAAIAEKRTYAGFMRLRTKHGETRTWSFTSTLRTEGVQFPCVRGVAHDVTDMLQAQKALRRSEERLRVAAEVGRMYAWEWDPATDSVQRSAECASILGLDDATGAGVAKDYFDLVHPDDRARVWRLATSLTPNDPEYRTEYRRFRPDGTLLWLQESGHATFDKAGKMLRLVGMTADVTQRKDAEEKLHVSEERSRWLVSASPVATVVTIGLEQQNEIVNDKFTALFGYSKEDVTCIADWWPLAYPDEAYREKIRTEWEARVAEAVGRRSEIAPMEARVCCKDGSYRDIEFHLASQGETNLVSFVDVTDRKLAQEELEKIGRRLIAAQEAESARIARELHDDFSQRLTLQGIGLARLLKQLPESEVEARPKIQELLKRNQEIAIDMHTLSHQLHSSKLEHVGLVPALMGLCEELSSKFKIQVEFSERGVSSNIPKDVALCLFRITQEAVSNIAKHSKAKQAQVEFSGTNNEVRLRIVDAGVGFDPALRSASVGIGLVSMRERLRLVGGTLSVQSEPMRGTEILAAVPLSISSNASHVRAMTVGREKS
jgi:PAS domain S-box-containing protein